MDDSTCTGNGRNGVAILAARNVTVERVAFDRNGGSLLDIEPYQASGGANHVRFVNNTGGTRDQTIDPSVGYAYLFAANGAVGSTVNDVTVSGNRVTGASIASIVSSLTTRRTNIVFADNVSTVAAKPPYNDAMFTFAHVDGLTVTGNVQPLTSGTLRPLHRLHGSGASARSPCQGRC